MAIGIAAGNPHWSRHVNAIVGTGVGRVFNLEGDRKENCENHIDRFTNTLNVFSFIKMCNDGFAELRICFHLCAHIKIKMVPILLLRLRR